MGCTVRVVGAAPSALAMIRRLFGERDSRFTRFSDRSELAWVNARAGRQTWVSAEFARMLRLALEMAAVSEGLVDPTIGRAIRVAGYDRDFAQLCFDMGPAGKPCPAPGWRSVRLRGRMVELPAGCELDLNGVVKSVTVDDAVALFGNPGFIAAGGDLAVQGAVDVALPGSGAVRLLEGGLATSGCGRRRWRRGGTWQHHLIDPSTGAPAYGPWEQVTVAGGSCLIADVAAKAAFIAAARGPAWLAERALPGRFVAPDGAAVETDRWRAMLGQPACI